MITLKSIHLKDFLSHKKTTVEVADGARLLVDGASGGGKSSIVDALIWCLYGVARADNRSLIRAGEEEAVVVCSFVVSPDFDGKTREYQITRKTNLKGKHSIEVLMGTDAGLVPLKATGTREIQRWIEHDFLRASYELFINSVVYPQGNRESFVESSAVRRKDLLMEILNVEDIEAYYEKTKQGIKEAEVQVSIGEGEMRSIDDRIEALDKATDNLDFLELDLTARVFELKEAEKKEVELRAKQVQISGDVARLKELQKQAADLRDHVERLCQKRNPIEAEYRALPQDLEGYDMEAVERDYLDVEFRLREATDRNMARAAMLSERPVQVDYNELLIDLDRQLTRISKDTPVCPSGDECPFVKQIYPEQERLKETIKEKAAARDRHHEEMHKWQDEFDKLPEHEDVTDLQAEYARLGEIRRNVSRFLELRPKLVEINNEINDQVEKQHRLVDEIERAGLVTKDADYIEADLGAVARVIVEAREKVSNLETTIALVKSGLEELENLKTRRKEVEERIAKAKALHTELLLLKDAFGSNGIRAIAIDSLIPRFEDKINEVLGQMSSFRIRLDTQRKSIKGESTIEGLFITIRNDQNQEFDFNNYSGGERLKITVAISEALASLQRCGFRILDELFVGLDEASTESFAHVLGQIQGRFSQMLCISHLRQIKDLFDQRIVVTKINGVSSVKYE